MIESLTYFTIFFLDLLDFRLLVTHFFHTYPEGCSLIRLGGKYKNFTMMVKFNNPFTKRQA